MEKVILKKYVKIRTGKLDVNASDENGRYPFFTCAKKISKINIFAFDCECVLVAGNGELNVKYYEGKFNAYQRTYVIESINKNILSVKYLYYFINNYIDKLRNGAIGGVIKYIKLNHLTDIELPIPDIETQNKIVSILDKATSLVNKRKETIQLLDKLLLATFLEIFGDPVINTKEWPKKPLSAFGEIITGNTPPRNISEYYNEKHIEWIKTDNIQHEKKYPTKAAEYLSAKGAIKGRVVDSNSILVACIAGSINSIGRVAITNRRVAFNQQINAIQPNKEVSSLFIYYLIKYSSKYIQNHATKGMKRIITKGVFKNIMLIHPPHELQLKFEKTAHITAGIKGKLIKAQIAGLSLLNSIAQKTFNSQLNIDTEAELNALINEIDLHKKENDLSSISGDTTYLQRLIDKLNYQEFSDNDMYDKAKHAIFQLMSEDEKNRRVYQEYNEESKSLKLVLR